MGKPLEGAEGVLFWAVVALRPRERGDCFWASLRSWLIEELAEAESFGAGEFVLGCCL